MPKGLFTASLSVLFEAPPSLDALEESLAGVNIAGRREAAPENPWLGGPSLMVPMRPEVNGLVNIDVVDRAWPDRMGDPQKAARLFGAWTLGGFGPFVFPGALERSVQQAVSWPEAAERVPSHQAFVRARVSYVFGRAGDAPVIPEDYDPLFELHFLTDLARRLLTVEGAVAYFAPSGEVVLDRPRLERLLEERAASEIPPLDAWTNVRFFRIGDEDGWALMDTIGNEQLGVPDLEACFPLDQVDPDEVAGWLRDVSLYLVESGPVIEDGHTIDGPGGVWKAHAKEESLAPAPRATVRWIPTSGGAPTEGML